jgi:hypothetical protein
MSSFDPKVFTHFFTFMILCFLVATFSQEHEFTLISVYIKIKNSTRFPAVKNI